MRQIMTREEAENRIFLERLAGVLAIGVSICMLWGQKSEEMPTVWTLDLFRVAAAASVLYTTFRLLICGYNQHLADIAQYRWDRIWMVPLFWATSPIMLLSWLFLRKTRAQHEQYDRELHDRVRDETKAYDKRIVRNLFLKDLNLGKVARTVCRAQLQASQLPIDEEDVRRRVRALAEVDGILAFYVETPERFSCNIKIVRTVYAGSRAYRYSIGTFRLKFDDGDGLKGEMLQEDIRIEARNRHNSKSKYILSHFESNLGPILRLFYTGKIDEALSVAVKILNDPEAVSMSLTEVATSYYVLYNDVTLYQTEGEQS